MGENSSFKHLRPSPNELEAALREEKQKWRIFRIQQVREQAREEAQRVLSCVRNQESRIKLSMKQDLSLKWQAEKQKEMQELQREYEDSTRVIGQAHKLAEQQPDAEKVLAERQQHNRHMAAQRGQEARKMEKDQLNQLRHEKDRLLQQRQEAMNKEKLRAARVASLPTPQAFKKKKPVVEKKVPKVQLHEAGTFTTTTYIPNEVIIEKEIWSTMPDARVAAEKEAAVQTEREKAQKKEAEEEERKREERGQKALTKERVTRLAQQLVMGLDDAQRRHHLSAFLGDAPSTVFEVEGRDAKQQKEMERAIERILEEPQPPTPDHHPPLSPDLSHGLEEYDPSITESGGQMPSSQEPHDLKSLLKQMKRRKKQLLQGLYNTLVDKQITGEEYDEEDSPELVGDMIPQKSYDTDRLEDPHLAEPVCDPSDRQSAPTPQKDLKEESDMLSRVPHTSAEDANSGLGSTDSESSLSSHQSRSFPMQDLEERLWKSEHQEEREDDIHLAETVPVDLLPLHRFTTRSTSTTHRVKDPPMMPQESESFQDSTSEDISINVELSAGSSGSTLKTVTPDESISRPGSPLPQVSEITSTDYLSLPSSLQELEKNLQEIQEKRRRTQRLLDSMIDRRQQETSPQSSTPSTYTQKLKEEGSGQRPLKRKEKLEMQKKMLLQYYLKKLLDMKKDEVENISASTVEGSGLSVSSLSSLLETWQRYSSSESSVTVMPSSSKEMTESTSDSSYRDIDQVPVKLSRISATLDESCSVCISKGKSRVPSTEISANLSTTSGESFRKDEPKKSSKVPSSLSTRRGESSTENKLSKVVRQDISRQRRKISSSSSSSSSLGTGGVLPPSSFDLGSGSSSEYISAFNKELNKPVPSEGSPHVSIHSHSRGRITTEQPSKNRKISEPRHQQEVSEEGSESGEKKLSVPEQDCLQKLSTPPPATSDASVTKNVSFSQSTSYHTPSREYESSLDGESDVSLPHGQGPPLQPSSLVRPPSEKSSDEQLNTLWSGRRFLHQHEKLSFHYRYEHKEYKPIKDVDDKMKPLVDNFKTNKNQTERPLPKVSTTHGNSMRNKESTLPLSSYTEDRSRTGTLEVQKYSHFSDQTQSQDQKKNDKSSEAASQCGSIGQTADAPRVIPVHHESTGSYSSGHSQQQQSHINQSTISSPHLHQYIPDKDSTVSSSQQHHATQISHTATMTQQHHRSELTPSSSSCTSPPPPESDLKTAKEKDESSESVTSMPDMGEILRRFGLDWADSMFRKMDRAPSNSSSGSHV